MSNCTLSHIEATVRDAKSFGVRALVRNGWELLAIITGDRENEEKAIEKLQEAGVLESEPVYVLSEARLRYSMPLAIMPCSHVSGLTARLIYGDATSSASLIKGRPELCVQEGVVHLREFALGPVDLPLHSQCTVYRRTNGRPIETILPIDRRLYASR